MEVTLKDREPQENVSFEGCVLIWQEEKSLKMNSTKHDIVAMHAELIATRERA